MQDVRDRLGELDIARPILEELDALDREATVAAIAAQLDASFVRYRQHVGDRPISKIDFYWAGAEIAPWVPSDVMGNVYAGKVLVLDSSGGFEPMPLPILCDALADDPALGDHAAFDDLKALFVAESITLAQRAIAVAVTSQAFAALATERPFVVTATPGHDEDEVVLLELA